MLCAQDWPTMGSALLQSESDPRRARAVLSTAPDDDRQTTLSFFMLAAVRYATSSSTGVKKMTAQQKVSDYIASHMA